MPYQALLLFGGMMKRIGAFLVVCVLLFSATTVSRAALNGSVSQVCTSGATVYVTITAIATVSNTSGGEQVGALVNSKFAWGVLPVDGQSHRVTVSVTLNSYEQNAAFMVIAGSGNGSYTAIGTAFAGSGTYSTTPCTSAPGIGIPTGFVLRTAVCTTPINDAPNGTIIGSNKLLAGQTWFVNPISAKAANGTRWVEVFIGSPVTVFVPAACIA